MMLQIIAVLLLSTLSCARQHYQADWDSLNSRPLPSWYDEAKFGIFIHWGVYSVPSWGDWNHYTFSTGAEWYWHRLVYPKTDDYYTWNFHNQTYGMNFAYQAFAPLFTAKMWDADRWAKLIADSGAKYTVLTSKHHEGFCNWQSAQSWNWNSVDNGPHRDLVGELAIAIRKTNVVFGLYHSLYEWFNPLYLKDQSSGSPPNTSLYVDEILIPQLKDIVKKYLPDIVWADGDWDENSTYWKSTEFLAWLYNDSPVRDTVVVNDRWGHECRAKNGGYWTPWDQFNPGHLIGHKWEDSATIGTSYGYNRNEHLDVINSASTLIHSLVMIVSTGGNLLLDIGPTADGLIPIIQEERLIQIGSWLNINGAAIYSTSPWRVQNDTADQIIWFTQSKDGTVNAIFLEWPQDNQLKLMSPKPEDDAKVILLGYSSTSLKWTYEDCMTVFLPSLSPAAQSLVTQPAWTLQMFHIN